MKLVHHVKRHSQTVACHLKKHHKKYLAGFFGGFAVVKLVALVIWLSAAQYSISTYAQEVWCEITGQYYTWEYETGCITIPESLTGGYLTDCVTVPGYFTGGTVNESGELVDQVWIEETQEWCILTGQETIPEYVEWCFMTWGYRTWGTEICDENLDDGTIDDGTIDENGDEEEIIEEEELGAGDQEEIISQWNAVCESGDIIWNSMISWWTFRNIFDITWAYSGVDCLASWISLQLRDHNDQRIDLATLESWATSYTFNSASLYSFQQSGLYHIIWTGLSGQYYLYTGTYSGEYSHLFTWYKLRLVDVEQTLISETWPFTIDNELPVLTGVTMLSNGLTTWYLNVSGVVTLSFTASELLSGVQATLWSGKLPTSSTVSWLLYTYTWNVTSLFTQGNLAATISFADIAGNTWSLVYTSSLVFDITRPTITWFVFTDYASGLRVNFTSSEEIRHAFTYQTSWSTVMTGGSSEYLTAHQLNFLWIARDILYTFTLNTFDRAGNTRAATGDMMRTSTWNIVSHVYIVPVVGETVLTWNLSTLATVLRAEIEKFNTCKEELVYTPVEVEIRRNTFTLQIPNFKKSQVKTLVNAFTLFVLDKMKHNYEMTPENITEISKKFDNFLVILKLLRDDDNECKQNLSNYHIGQFKKALEEFNLTVE